MVNVLGALSRMGGPGTHSPLMASSAVMREHWVCVGPQNSQLLQINILNERSTERG